MSTEFLAMLPPPGAALSQLDHAQLSTAQPDSIPATFLEAMSVREEVFVKEQHCKLENEVDEDDARSWHWVTYVSVASNSSTAQASGPQKRGSTASRLAVATIRLVPPPHDSHPNQDPHTAKDANSTGHSRNNSQHAPNSPDEPYIKLGRLCTLQQFRKLRLGKLLVDSALQWASEHADDILPPRRATDREAARVEAGGEENQEALLKEREKETWRGLVLIHAQKSVEPWYAKLGFVKDDDMGEWIEEGIAHVGMWRRISVGHGIHGKK